ncbi:DUF2339 domain-containing protein [Sphingomonas sp. SRS2]|uniref:DUF2339 domain-containing protein n=1 Tax=Sphingomonas sp. SRS2 TaxID=133190 RepID=UPI0006184499|nr:DUF2339 domain-containing protein [Sphingomonas sp. SRS2]KKC24602.1 membrane protein [Sphingomonas sp. SRS2]
MILWGVIVGAMLGWLAADFEQYGLLLGALPGAAAGWGLRKAVRAEIAAMLATGRAEAPASAPSYTVKVVQDDIAAPAPASAPVSAHERVRPAASVVVPAPAVIAAPAEPGIVERGFAAARGWLLGGNTIVRAGLVVLFVGLAFLARWAAGAGLIPIEVRLALVAAAGIALLAIGFNRRTARPGFALALQGGGVAVLYLTIFAGAILYPVLPLPAAFALMVLVCIGGCALALLQDAEGLAGASFAGGYAVPLLLGGEGGPVVVMFGYHALLNLGVLLLAWKKPWRSINLIGFFATFGIASFWGVLSYRPEDFAVAQSFLLLSVLIYLAAAILYARNRQGPMGRMVDSSLLFGVALAGFGLQVGLVRDIDYGSAFAALGFGALYLGLAVAVMRRGGEAFRLLAETMLAIGVGFATLAIPLALGARWTGSAWALEGAGAFWVGMRQARWIPRLFGMLLILLSALLFIGMLESNVSALPLLNPVFMTGLLVALPAFAVAWWLREPLPHSGSRWALGYARVEAVLGKPAFLSAFLLWCLTLAAEACRTLPAADTSLYPAPAFRAAIQQQLVMLGIVASAWGWSLAGRRTGWSVATWPGRATLVILFATWLGQAAIGEHMLYNPGWAIWLTAIALHVHLLLLNDRDGPAAGTGTWLLARASHVGGVWLATLLLADALWLGIDRAALWDSSWAGVVFLVSAVAILLVLTLWAGRGHDRWPLDRHRNGYHWQAALPLAALVYGGALAAALLAEGDAHPLPYIPLLNPVDLVVLLGLAALVLWRRSIIAADPTPAGSGWLRGRGAWIALAGLGFVAVNMMWLRFAHQALGVAWSSDALLDDHVVQTGLAILWTLLALGLMLFAHRRAQRPVWLAGAALLVLVVLKLFFVDLSSAGGGARIISFIVVGVLMLVVGYVAPLPPRRGGKEETP